MKDWILTSVLPLNKIVNVSWAHARFLVKKPFAPENSLTTLRRFMTRTNWFTDGEDKRRGHLARCGHATETPRQDNIGMCAIRHIPVKQWANFGISFQSCAEKSTSLWSASRCRLPHAGEAVFADETLLNTGCLLKNIPEQRRATDRFLPGSSFLYCIPFQVSEPIHAGDASARLLVN